MTHPMDYYGRIRELEQENEALKKRDAEWQALQQKWLASPEAAQRFDGYRELAAKCAHLEEQCDTKEREILRLLNIVCSAPACSAAIVRRDDGSRVCAAGHSARWVNVDVLYALEAKLGAFREACALAAQGAVRARQQTTDQCREEVAAAVRATPFP